MKKSTKLSKNAAPDFLAGGGEMGALMRQKDWSQTPLGPIEHWPQSLRTAISLCLASNFPINIIWGPKHTQIYNDGYRVCCGEVHPRALGEAYSVTWASAWPAIGEPFARALAGATSYLENQRMFLTRNGYLEETFFTFSHSPIRDESGGIGGLFHPVTETTATMLAERRTRALRDLSASLGVATDEAEVARRTVEILSRFEFDLPFLLYYALSPKAASYHLAGQHGIAPGTPSTPLSIERDAADPWPFAEALGAWRIVEVNDLPSILQGESCGPYEEPPNQAFVVPIAVPAAERPPAVIVVGASPRLPLTGDYRSFYDLLSVTISGALATVRAREDERRRADALAKIDRAKTLFFSNVSHEFRTPLTLMLGPLEDALADAGTLADVQRERLDVAHRNALRLLKLVNSLLDFSRVEAGRIQASYEPIDLAALTSGLASTFRSACARAGVPLVVDCARLPEPVYVDRDMWEKIVLNLLSNAFKFTFEGEIEVALRPAGEAVELTVRDTGVGIPAAELPRLFERFHRIEGQRGRSHEGTGIGLALVQELVKLHSGAVRVESIVDRGTTFTIAIPRGRDHLPAERIGAARTLASTATRAQAYVEEALGLLPGGEAGSLEVIADTEPFDGVAGEGRERILLADDNADMREYIARLLGSRWKVEAVNDGEAALASARRQRPDLILADVMMPRLDGFGLLKAVRADRNLREVPVIMLSARAGEEARVEGLDAGADDYLTKPFSARELVARVKASLDLARVRQQANEALRESEARFRHMADNAPVMVWVTDPTAYCTYLSRSWYEFTGQTEAEGLGLGWTDAIHPDDRDRSRDIFLAANAKHEAFRLEYRLRRHDGEYRWAIDAAAPRFGEDGAFLGYIGSVIDITERKQDEERRTLLLHELNHRVKNTLATVQSIAMQTLRGTEAEIQSREAFEGRLVALSRAHNLLTEDNWQSAGLREILIQELEPYRGRERPRFQIDGPEVRLEPGAALALGMAFHELATNAVKHGALSNGTGQIRVAWTMTGARPEARLRLDWQEAGGPPVEPPRQRGFGSRLMERGLAQQLDGTVRVDYAPQGVVCTIDMPLSSASVGHAKHAVN